ncbi:MAG: ribosome recycling factor [Glaciecola sp.]|jgi:ribosome recycling factor
MIDETLADADKRMEQAADKVSEDFSSIRTGRANPQILNKLRVEYYGTPTPLQQLATFAVPEPRMLVVSPYDKGSLNDIEKAIRDSDLGLNPSNDGNIIRCAFPELTNERRKDFIRIAKEYAEQGRIAIRNIRRSAKDALQALVDDGNVGQDEHDRAAKKLEELTGAHVTKIDKALESKEQDLLEV